jgi:TonB family protein
LNAPKQILKLIIVFFLADAFGQVNTSAGTQVGQTGGVEKVGGPVSAPGSVYAPAPEYSPEARKAKYEGTCVLWLIVDTDGHPHNIRVAHAVGYGLDEKAIEAVKRWKFKPAMKDGRPVAVQINVEVRFRLYDKPGTNPNSQIDAHPSQKDKTSAFTEAQLTMLSAQWSKKTPYSQEKLTELRAKCTPYINTKIEDLESNRVPLPPHECSGVLAWMRNLRVKSLYVSEKHSQ